MDYELVSDALYQVLHNCYHHAVRRPDDPCTELVLTTLSDIPAPEDALRHDDPRGVAEFYYQVLMTLRGAAQESNDSWVRGYILGVTTRLEHLSDLGIIDETMPVKTYPQPEQPQPIEDIEDELWAWRVESFRELKFTQREAEALAAAKTPAWIKVRSGEIKLFESPLAYSRVKRMLDGGCNHRLAVSILT